MEPMVLKGHGYSREKPGKCSETGCTSTTTIDCTRCHSREWCYKHLEYGQFTPLYCEKCRIIRSNNCPYLVIDPKVTEVDMDAIVNEVDELGDSMHLFYERAKADEVAQRKGWKVIRLHYSD